MMKSLRKNFSLLLTILTIFVFLTPAVSYSARTDGVWDNYTTYTKTTMPAGLDILVNGSNHYINFNTVVGTNGYGFRDFGGVMQFKDSGGTWAAFGSGGGGTGTVTSVASADGSITVTNPTTTVDLAVVKAPKWTTARLLAGNSVDGSANVTFANKFIVQGTTDTGLTGAQFLGSLGTGIVKNTTTTGVLSIASAGTDYEVPLTFSTGLTRTTNTITVNTSQNIAKLSNLTSNGFVKTSASDGTLSIDTNTYLTSVTGTTNRITVTGGSVIDIAATYVGQSSITTLGTIGTGVWNGTLISPTYGGTGINNGSSTLTLGGNLTTSGAFATTFTMTAATGVTFPTTGTLATLAGSETFTNKTLTNSNNILGGVTMTLGSDASYDTYYRSSGGVLTRLANGSTGQFLGANTSAAPTWQTPSVSVPQDIIAGSGPTTSTTQVLNHNLGKNPTKVRITIYGQFPSNSSGEPAPVVTGTYLTGSGAYTGMWYIPTTGDQTASTTTSNMGTSYTNLGTGTVTVSAFSSTTVTLSWSVTGSQATAKYIVEVQ